MRLLLLNHYAGTPALGMEYRPYYLAREWVKLGHEVMIVAADHSHVRTRQPAAGDETIDGIAYRWVATPPYQGNGMARMRNILAYLTALWAGADGLARGFRPDAVIASSTYPLDIWPAQRIARRAGAKLVHEVHDLWPLSPIELSGMSPWHPFAIVCRQAENTACREADAVLHRHDLDPLPVAVRLKQLTGARIVYDAHELETEMAGLSETRKVLARVAERRGMPFVDEMITVSPSIKAWYEAAFPGQRVSLVRNVPERQSLGQPAVNLRGDCGVPENALLFLYLGGLSEQRGVELMLSAFEDPRVPHHLLMMGSGPLLGAAQAAAVRCGRIHHRRPVRPAEVLRYAAGADAGVSLSEGLSLNNRYCLPNKLFESLLAGLPVLVSDLPDQAALVAEYGCGWPTACELPAIVDTLLRVDAVECRRVKQGLLERTAGLDWAHEAQVLRALYARLGFAAQAAPAAAEAA